MKKLLLALSVMVLAVSCKPKPPPSKVTFATVCGTQFDPKGSVARDVTIEGYLTLPKVGTACSSTCLINLWEKRTGGGYPLSTFVKVGTGPSTMDALGATYTLADLKVRDAKGALVDLTKRVRLTGWRAGQGGMGCGINPDVIEVAE